jgi:ligand-binding sensor domain-containing protein
VVTALAAGPNALWVGTHGGHLVVFDPITADVLSVHQKSYCISLLLCLSSKRLVAFGEGILGEGEEGGDVMGVFTVWENYIE